MSPKELGGSSIKRWGDSDDVKALPHDSHGRPYLRGHFIQLKKVEGQFGEGVLLEIDTIGPDAERQTWACPTRLRIACEKIMRAGQLIVIFPLAERLQMKGGSAYNFKVFMLLNHETAEEIEWGEDADIDFK